MKTDRRELWFMVALTLATAILRAQDVLGRSMWLDEGTTLMRLNGSWLMVLSNLINVAGVSMIDTHPPVYFLALKWWTSLAGYTEFALKWFSVVCGVLAEPLIYVLARKLFNRRTAVIAAVMLLLSGLMQWYSHELRMYTLVVCAALLSTYLFYKALYPAPSANRVLGWLAWIVCSVLACLTIYPLGALFAAQVLVGLVIILRQPEKLHRDEALTLGAATIVGMLLLLGAYFWPPTHSLFYRLFTGVERDYSFVPLDVIVQSILGGYIFGVNATDPTQNVIVWGTGVLCVLGALLPLDGSADDKRTRNGRVIAAAVTLGPMLVWFAISYVKPNFQGVRHLILVVPGVALLVAHAFDVGLRWRPSRRVVPRITATSLVVCLIVVLLASEIYGTAYVFIHTPGWQDDWRGMAYYVRDHWQEGDVLVINSEITNATVDFYVPDLHPIVAPPIQYSADQPEAVAQRQELLKKYKRIWFSNTGTGDGRDPGITYRWLDEHAYHRGSFGFPTRTRFITVDLFDVQSPVSDALPASAHAVGQVPEGAVGAYIAGYEINPGDAHNPQPNLWLSLYWKRVDTMDVKTHSTSFRLSDQAGITWASWFMPAELDAAPASWAVGQYYRVDYVVPIPIGLPERQYALEMTAQMSAKAELMQRVTQALPADSLTCCMRIAQWPALPLSEQHDVWQAGDAILQKAEFLTPVKPGDVLPVALTWKLLSADAGAWQTSVRLEPLIGADPVTASAGEDSGALFAGPAPLSEPVRELKSLQVPYSAAVGLYRLTLTRHFSATTRADDGILLGLVRVEGYPASPLTQQPQYSVSASVGDMDLLGYSIDQPITRGVTLNFHTFWQVVQQPTRDGVLFLHLVTLDGKPVAQDDNPPEQGKRSTLTYRAGDGIDQIHQILLSQDTPSGEYLLYAGIYDRASGVRWSATQDGAPARDNLVYLGKVTLSDSQ
jgi:hypothetical protein